MIVFKDEKLTYTPSIKENNAVPVWFCFPSTYMIGMSSLGYLELFRILDTMKSVYPERVFTDTEKTVHNPKNVELIGFSFSFELDFMGVFKILEKNNIPFRSSDRSDFHPIIFGGGPVLMSNPEPYADFFDVVLIGDGEELFVELMTAYNDIKHLKSKREKLIHLSKIPGVYIPSLYNVEYNADDTVKSFEPLINDIPSIVNRRCISPLDGCIYTPILTEKSFFPGTFLLEVSRGCPRRCRFCMASYLNLPARYPLVENIIKTIDKGLEYSNKIGLLGALIAEHPHFDEICKYIIEKRNSKDFEMSVSSLRADKITPLTVKTLTACGQKSSTIAVEAGSDRLRSFINKQLNQEQIVESVKIARENGLTALKIYGMLGLPTEQQEDIQQMVDLMTILSKENKGFKLTLSVSSFVPKALTPFQWDKREENKLIQEKSDFLRKNLAKTGVSFKPTSAKWDYIQAVLSLGDRRLAPLIEAVYKHNATLGSWSRSYKEITEDCNIKIPSLDWYALREKNYNEILPWEFIHSGVDKSILQKEREKSYNDFAK